LLIAGSEAEFLSPCCFHSRDHCIEEFLLGFDWSPAIESGDIGQSCVLISVNLLDEILDLLVLLSIAGNPRLEQLELLRS
jgi:hypothetical protein